MTSGRIEFDQFIFDAAERRLSHANGEAVDIAGRNFDVLALLITEAGALVSKDRFMEQVWRGVPVTDEALTQSIRSLRKALGDDAVRPRFIETVPKFGYRFVAPVKAIGQSSIPQGNFTEAPPGSTTLQQLLTTGLSGTAGGAFAGLVGGLIYGFTGAAVSSAGGSALSVLLVLLMLTVALATIGGAAVSFGIAAAEYLRKGNSGWIIAGGAAGGMAIGAVAHLLGMDSFTLLFGAAPQDITGAREGALLGAAAAASLWLMRRYAGRYSLVMLGVGCALIGALSGTAIVLSGGQLLAGSLAQLLESFPQARLQLNGVEGASLAQSSLIIATAFEAALFCCGVAVTISLLAHRSVDCE